MKNSSLHIAILTDQLYKIGGINKLIEIKTDYWVNTKSYNASIITTEQFLNEPFYQIHPKVNLYDLDINYDRSKSYFGSENIFKVIKNYLKLNSLLREIKPDIVIIANHIPVTLFFPLINTNAKFAKEYHFTQFFKSRRKKSFFSKIESYVESKLDFQIVLNPEEQKFYHKSSVVHIPNPIQEDLKKLPEFKSRESIAIAAGRISSVKRFDILIDIWSDFKKVNTEWKLEIYGDGPEEDVNKLIKLIKTLRLEESVKIIKPVSNLIEVMKKKGLYLMTSEQECFPMVLLEAQLSGLPIISYDCPTGPRNIIQSLHNGYLIKLDDKALFVDAIKKLVEDDQLREALSLNGFESVKKYRIDSVMQQWDQKILNRLT